MTKKNSEKNGKGNGAFYVLGGLALVAAAAVIMGMDDEGEEDEDLEAGKKAREPDTQFTVGDYEVDIIKDDDGEWQWFALQDGEVMGAGSAMSPFDAKFQSKKWASKSTGERLKSGDRLPLEEDDE